MLEVTFVGWAATLALIAALFVLDLFISRPGHAHTVAFREAVVASLFYIGVALAFGVAFGLIAGWDWGVQYFAGYLVEKSLSVDNLFVFVMIMSTFAVPVRASAAGAHVRHHGGAHHARDLHRTRRRADVGVLVHVLDLRGAADRHGGAAVPASR